MANGLAGLFGGTSLGGGQSLYQAIFPLLFGNGSAGAVTLGTIADGGYLGAFGAPQYTSVTLPSGASVTIPPGSGNGALLIACQGTVTLGGSIVANGGNAVSYSGTGTAFGGAGGGTAGGGAGGVQSNTNGVINLGAALSRYGHGCLPNTSLGAPSGSVPTSGSGVLGAISLAADNTYGQGGSFDPITGLRFSVPQIGSGQILTTAVSAASLVAAGAQSRALGPSTLYPRAGSLCFDALPSGLPGLCGNTTATSPTGNAIGGGGGGGGVVYIEANTIVFQSGHSIQAKGGAGGNTIMPGNGVGGMGGDGGLVILIANQFIGTPNVSVGGGTAGTSASGSPTPLASQAGRFLMINV